MIVTERMAAKPLLFWICIVSGILLITFQTYRYFKMFMYDECELDSAEKIMLVLETTIASILTVHHLWRIYLFYTAIKVCESHWRPILMSLLMISVSFIVNWASYCLNIDINILDTDPHRNCSLNVQVHCVGGFPVLMLGVHLFVMIGHYFSQSPYVLIGMLPFLLFVFKFYAITSFALSVTLGISPVNYTYAVFYIGIITAIAIWWKYRSLEREMSQHNIEFAPSPPHERHIDHLSESRMNKIDSERLWPIPIFMFYENDFVALQTNFGDNDNSVCVEIAFHHFVHMLSAIDWSHYVGIRSPICQYNALKRNTVRENNLLHVWDKLCGIQSIRFHFGH